MSDNLTDLIKNYTIKYDSKVQKICEPLKNQLGVAFFEYLTIDADGRFFKKHSGDTGDLLSHRGALF